MGCGIYKITNTIDGKVYIGSSINLKHRLSIHKSNLRGKYHHNIHLQNAWNKYGEYSFVFEILLYCDKKDLLFYEDRAIEEYKSLDKIYGYNYKSAERVDLTGSNYEEMCRRMSKNHADFSGKKHPKAKSVTINGKYYGTMKEAAKDYGLSRLTLLRRLEKGIDLNKTISMIGKNNPMYGRTGKNHSGAKPITINGKYYKSRKEAAQDLGMEYSTFLQRIKRNVDINIPISKANNGKNNPQAKPVIINNKYYDTIKEAAQDLKMSPQGIKYRIKTNKQGYKYV